MVPSAPRSFADSTTTGAPGPPQCADVKPISSPLPSVPMVVSVHRVSPLTMMPAPPPTGTRSSARASAPCRPASPTAQAATNAAVSPRSRRHVVCNAILPSTKKDAHPKGPRQSNAINAHQRRSRNRLAVPVASSDTGLHGNMNRTIGPSSGGPSVSKSDRTNTDRKDGVPRTLTTIPLTDPHALSAEPSIGELVKEATAQMSTLVRAEVELARAEITRAVKKGLTGSVFFIAALVGLFYSTFFFFFFLAELLDTWIWRWAAFLIVFGIMVVVTLALALFGYLKVRRIRGPQQTIESVKETRSALTPGQDKSSAPALHSAQGGTPADPSGW